MSRKLFVVAALLFALTAQAEHHRGHADGHLDSLQLQLNQMDKKVRAYEEAVLVNGCVLDSSQLTHIEVLFRYSGFAKDSAVLAQERLADPEVDLDVVRRQVNQPNSETPQSISNLILGLQHRARMLITACPAANGQLAGVHQRIGLAWQQLDRTIWHVTDAIREEVYLDPAQICGGPGNHCE